MITYKNLVSKTRKKFIEANDGDLSDSDFYSEDLPYVFMGTFIPLYLKKNKILFYNNKKIDTLFEFINECFESNDEKLNELFYVEVFPYLSSNIFIKRQTKNRLEKNALKEFLLFTNS
jgi:hypothetical protein